MENSTDVIPVVGAKSDFVERDAENLLVIYLYVKGIRKETTCVEFTEDSITAHFSTRCEREGEGGIDEKTAK